MSDDYRPELVEPGDSAVAKLVNAMLLAAIKKDVHHIAIHPKSVQYWRASWVEEMRPPEQLHLAIIQRFGFLIDAFPGPNHYVSGKLHMLIGERDFFFLVVIDRAEVYRVWVERVDELAFRRRDLPDPPAHPDRPPI